jgi:hypothetical protein
MHGGLKFGSRTEFLYDLHGRADLSERCDMQHTRIIQIDNALVLILVQQPFEYGLPPKPRNFGS